MDGAVDWRAATFGILLGCGVQWSELESVLLIIDLCALGEKKLRRLDVPSVGRGMQWREPALVPRANVSTSAQERFNDVEVAVKCSKGQRRLVISTLGIDVRAFVQELLNTLDVARLDRVVNRFGRKGPEND